MEDDDIWASSDEDVATYDREIAQREWDKLNMNHGNEGYKEGISEAKEEYMQEGFDRGYKEGLEMGKAIGKLRGILCGIDVQHVFSKEYFQDNKDADPRLIVKQWEEKVQSLLVKL
ncbi:hypothetical protein BDB00DRAFT_757174 [Zychaea mexicana]|uniref:uncharacterized protein n=1 Tax=Zychaea mexicana TaxID=64656 RepID=UPI0022FE052C|nr:uncharacterized protein BDB00DRAFT_757174 [Zychaea mexicana]KAI9497277.1 hypothetical protein BDB00DRAFT_757174 [Zychaea mexicana]